MTPRSNVERGVIAVGELNRSYAAHMLEAMQRKSHPLARPSMMSLHLEMRWCGQHLGEGTGFLVVHGGALYLITNRHNLAGRRSDSNRIISSRGVEPDEVLIRMMTSLGPMEWEDVPYRLRDEGDEPLWFEHPFFGRRVDVVALELPIAAPWGRYHVFPYPLDLQDPELRTMPSDPVSVVGFPYGNASYGGMAIWSRGYIASEVHLQYEGLPRFLIDARTTSGQSGSPVIAYSPGGQATLADGTTQMAMTETLNLLGVYSGRIDRNTDIGMVWRAEVIEQIIAAGMLNPQGLEWPGVGPSSGLMQPHKAPRRPDVVL